MASANTKATIASTTGTARMATQGSWRAVVGKFKQVLSPAVVNVSWDFKILEVGLKTTLPTSGIPVEIPPKVPPA